MAVDGKMPPVSQTAIGVALIRAYESARPDRLFDDCYARLFVEAAPDFMDRRREALARDAGRRGGLGAVIAFYGVIRTRYFDDRLRAAVTGGCTQVVLVAAGLDTRAYRLPWPAATELFELDLPEVLAFKDRVLSGERPRCERTAVAVDLRTRREFPDPFQQRGRLGSAEIDEQTFDQPGGRRVRVEPDLDQTGRPVGVRRWRAREARSSRRCDIDFGGAVPRGAVPCGVRGVLRSAAGT